MNFSYVELIQLFTIETLMLSYSTKKDPPFAWPALPGNIIPLYRYRSAEARHPRSHHGKRACQEFLTSSSGIPTRYLRRINLLLYSAWISGS